MKICRKLVKSAMAASGSLENPHVLYKAWHYLAGTFLSERAINIMGM